MKPLNLTRLPVTWDDFKDVEYEIPHNIVRYDFKYDLDPETYSLAKLGLIEDEILCFDEPWLYYFDMRGWAWGRFSYKFLITENSNGATIDEVWVHPRQPEKFDANFIQEVAESSLSRVIRFGRIRNQPIHIDQMRKKPSSMNDYKAQALDNLHLPEYEFYKLAWGFFPRSMDDHWMSWFDFETDTLHAYWHWRKLHQYQIRFDQTHNKFKAVELRIAEPSPIPSASVEHAWGTVGFFVKQCGYRIVESNQ